MKILQDSTELYGDVKFTLTDEKISRLKFLISDKIHSSISYNDTVLKSDAKILVWTFDKFMFKSETMTYDNVVLTRIKFWLQQ